MSPYSAPPYPLFTQLSRHVPIQHLHRRLIPPSHLSRQEHRPCRWLVLVPHLLPILLLNHPPARPVSGFICIQAAIRGLLVCQAEHLCRGIGIPLATPCLHLLPISQVTSP